MPESLQRDIQILSEHSLSFEYFKNYDEFQRSLTSTTCEYVICNPANLRYVIDCKKRFDLSMAIILRTELVGPSEPIAG